MVIYDYRGSETPAEAFAKYARDGYALFPKLFRDTEVDELLMRAMLHRGDAQSWRGQREDGIVVHWSAAHDPLLDSIRTSPRLFDIVGHLLDTRDIRQLAHQLHYRDKDADGPARWRRDEELLAPGLAEPRGTVIGTSLILDDVLSVEQGAILFVPGSHKGTDEIVAPVRCEAALPRRGMVAIWNMGIVRGSTPNLTHRDRRSLVQVYARADASAGGAWAWRDGVGVNYVAEGAAERGLSAT